MVGLISFGVVEHELCNGRDVNISYYTIVQSLALCQILL